MFFPLTHSPDIDLVAVRGGDVVRVQVKTSACVDRRGRFVVTLSTSGGNQSWNRVIKLFSVERCDRLFVTTGDGRRWFIPSAAVGGGRAIVLGGPKYAEFEVEPGRPLAVVTAA